jgi:hypothetical protein
VDLQSRPPQHGSRWHHPETEVSVTRLYFWRLLNLGGLPSRSNKIAALRCVPHQFNYEHAASAVSLNWWLSDEPSGSCVSSRWGLAAPDVILNQGWQPYGDVRSVIQKGLPSIRQESLIIVADFVSAICFESLAR